MGAGAQAGPAMARTPINHSRLAGAGAQAGPAMARTPSDPSCASVSVTSASVSVTRSDTESGRVASGLSPYGVVSFVQPLVQVGECQEDTKVKDSVSSPRS